MKNNYKILMSLIMSLFLCLTSILPNIACADINGNIDVTNNHNDIKGHWAEKELEKLIDKGIIKGSNDKGKLVIKPDEYITRAEFVTLVTRAIFNADSLNNEEKYKNNISFDDCKDHWAKLYVNLAKEKNIIKGSTDGKFYPNNKITRAEVAAIIVRIKDFPDNLAIKDIPKFKDLKDGFWANEDIIKATKFGFVKGYSNGNFNPLWNAKRAEAAVMINRYLDFLESSNTAKPVNTIEPISTPTPGSNNTEPISTPTPGSNNTEPISTSTPVPNNTEPISTPVPAPNTEEKESPIISFDTKEMNYDDQNKVYSVVYNAEPINSINGTITDQSDISDIKYSIKSGGLTLQSGSITASKKWSIQNPILLPGKNTITITATDKYSNVGTESLDISNLMGTNTDKLVLDSKDDDNDKLLNFQEDYYKTDKNLADTDGDGLTDYQELMETRTNPLVVDSDYDGVLDCNEDYDKDNVINILEYQLNGNPANADTDFDNLSDADEVKYNTKLNDKDTDGDGFTDNNEILYGTNPLVPDTDGDGIKDGDETFIKTFSVNEEEKDPVVEASVTMNVYGKNIDDITVSNAAYSNSDLTPDIAGYIGAPYEFSTTAQFNTAKIWFKFDKSLLSNSNFQPAIYYYNESTELLELLDDQQVDLNAGIVSVNTTHFSTYVLLDKYKVDEVWNMEMKDPYEGDINSSSLVIGFAIDSSGSMTSSDPEDIRKQAAKNFVDNMKDSDKAAVIDFDDYATVNCSLTNDKETIKNAINQVDSYGGTDLAEGIKASINELKDSDSASKYIIMLTDGEGYYDNTLTQEAKDLGISIYTIGLGDYVDEGLLKNIAEETGGKYYHASSNMDLTTIFDDASEDTVDLSKDSDNDGLSDYHEKKGMRTSTGKWIYTDPLNPDTDGDGLLDGEELVFESQSSIQPKTAISFLINASTQSSSKHNYVKVKSDPKSKDTDNDGIPDKQDSEKKVYNITDRTLALVAGLSYTNLESSKNKKILQLINDNFIGIDLKGIDKTNVQFLKAFTIVGANDSSATFYKDFWDSGLGFVAVKISRKGKKPAVILAIRGTESFANADGITDALGAISYLTPQSKDAYNAYDKLASNFSDADFFLAGHSLGGRIVQDVLQQIWGTNFGPNIFTPEIKVPKHAATFNGFGYIRSIYAENFSFAKSIGDILNNYYYAHDLVGDWLGSSTLYCRLGNDIGPWVAKDANGNRILSEDFVGFSPSGVHSIRLWIQDQRLILQPYSN